MTTLLLGAWSALRLGEQEGVAPAFSACVRVRGELVHASLHGIVRDEMEENALRVDDLFDVSALTEVLATASVAVSLAAEGKLELEAPVAEVLPPFAQGGKERVTFRELFAHASGLPAWRPWYEAAARDSVAGLAFRAPDERPPSAALAEAFLRGRELVVAAVLAEPLEVPPKARTLHSDAGLVALGLALEKLGGAPLATLAEERVFAPLGLRSTFFLDRRHPEVAAARAAGRLFLPTGYRASRCEVSRAAVHDDNAWAMGGVAGHAGVFSTAEEVAAVGQAWLDALLARDSVLPTKETLAFAQRDPSLDGQRVPGWELPGGRASLGERLGRGARGAMGQVGRTGCSLWIDLDAQIVCVLLSNYTHPGGAPDPARIDGFRRRFHDAVAEALGISPPAKAPRNDPSSPG